MLWILCIVSKSQIPLLYLKAPLDRRSLRVFEQRDLPFPSGSFWTVQILVGCTSNNPDSLDLRVYRRPNTSSTNTILLFVVHSHLIPRCLPNKRHFPFSFSFVVTKQEASWSSEWWRHLKHSQLPKSSQWSRKHGTALQSWWSTASVLDECLLSTGSLSNRQVNMPVSEHALILESRWLELRRRWLMDAHVHRHHGLPSAAAS